ncbi:hypothetical protein BT67DRAFT_421377 [Trichocladium antarcticum]|uniref:Mediator of RNA polymerase II transcription subunit 4 n=1 Tax=Trichocladium antarcticum TaxID=1450529 RepID=A0AAN6UMW6_9PEZI|nr:hypothetical protein BT67DRAFT_421377 [Trichocladium antarcticum]
MDKDLDGRFERVERALERMVESLAKNHPSEKLAEELVAADTALTEGLKLLERHQNNYARIQALRQETAQLDTQLKDLISSAYNMRKELKAVPVTAIPPNSKYDFTTAQLLDYARRISRNTLPPPGVTNGVDLAPTPAATQPEPDDAFPVQSQSQSQSQSQTQTQTPTTSFNLSSNGAGTPQQPPTSQTTTTTTTTATALPPHLKTTLNPLHNAAFYPWPTESQIRSGALAAVQRLAERGIDPQGYDPEAEAARRRAEEAALKEAEERARAEREAAERRMREERERMARERARARQAEAQAGGGGVAARRAPKQFTFLGGDDDDEEEDED